MKFIHHSDLDKKRWDALAAKHNADVFSYSWYLDACAQDWCVLVDANYENGIALPFAVKLGIKAISPPIFVRNLDFIGNDAGFRMKALEMIKENYKVGHLQFVLPLGSPPKMEGEGKTRIHQTITTPSPLNQQARRMLQKAVKQGITVQQTSDWRPIVQIIREELSEKISEFTPENIGRLEKLVASLESEEKLLCLGIYSDGKLEGGMLFMDSATQRIYLKGASSRKTRDLGGMYLCMKEAIDETMTANKTFDFGGSEVEGVRRFNLNLGGTDRPYYIYSWNHAPWWFNLTKSMYQKWKKK